MTDDQIKTITRGFFSKKELECKCKSCKQSGNPECNMDVLFLKKLMAFRAVHGKPFIPNSGYRCVKHPYYSNNHNGYGVDVPCYSGYEAYGIIDTAIRVGITRIGICDSENFIHLDCNPEYNGTLLETVIFTYPNS